MIFRINLLLMRMVSGKIRDFEADEYGYLSIYRFQLISTSKK